jgi:co-chaperonin GroES (HSP10)
MEIVDKRKFTVDGEKLAEAYATQDAERQAQGYDSFKPTLSGFQPLFDTILLRELKLENDSLISRPDAFAEPTLFGEVIATGSSPEAKAVFSGDIVRFLANVGSTIFFSDGEDGQRYLTIRAYDIIGRWGG